MLKLTSSSLWEKVCGLKKLVLRIQVNIPDSTLVAYKIEPKEINLSPLQGLNGLEFHLSSCCKAHLLPIDLKGFSPSLKRLALYGKSIQYLPHDIFSLNELTSFSLMHPVPMINLEGCFPPHLRHLTLFNIDEDALHLLRPLQSLTLLFQKESLCVSDLPLLYSFGIQRSAHSCLVQLSDLPSLHFLRIQNQ